MQVLANFEDKLFLSTDKFSIGFKQIQCTIHEVKPARILEPVCCKKRQKIVPDQLLVCGRT